MPVDVTTKPSYVVNATGAAGLLVELAVPCRVERFNVFGKPDGASECPAGLHRLPIKASGYARIGK